MKSKIKRTAPARETRSFKLSAQSIEVRANADGSKTVSGIAAPFNSQSVDLGQFFEVIAPGAFTRTLKENPDVLCLRDHKQEYLLGRTTSGTLTLKEDMSAGLRFTVNLPNTTQANDLAESLRRGDIDSCSFGFVTVKDDWRVLPDSDVLLRVLQDVDLFEISIVSFPAYPDSKAALRSVPAALRSRLKRSDDNSDTDPCDESSPDYDADKCEDEEDRCECRCERCVDGDCADCLDVDCDDELCSACPMQDYARTDKVRVRQLFQHRMSR